MSRGYRVKKLAATTSAVDWEIEYGDDFQPESLTINFDSAPTTAENITISYKDADGSTFDGVARTIDPVGETAIFITEFPGLKNGDILRVQYTNTDGNSITGKCIADLDKD